MTTPQIPVLYQDEHLVAIDKPAWSVVHKTRGAKGALVLAPALSEQLKIKVYPVHRLDRQTSGVMVFALTKEDASLLGAQVRDGIWRKTYLGLCRGAMEEPIRIESEVPEGKFRRPATTVLEPLEIFCGRYTLVRATPRTGRRHQIRYHHRHIHNPLVCDVNYGDGKVNRLFRQTFELGRMFLHAETLKLPHPVEFRMMELQVGLPPDLEGVLDKLRGYEGPVA